MKKKNFGFKILSVFISVLFLWSGVSWPAPDACLRPRSTGERSTAQKVQADIARLNEMVTQCSLQLHELRARLGRKKTRGDTDLFGLVAERRMLILQDMARLKRWLVASNEQVPVPVVDFAAYQVPVSAPADPQAGEVVSYSFLPDDKIGRAGAQGICDVGAAHLARTLFVYMSGGKGTRLRELYEMSDDKRRAMGIDTPCEKFEDTSKPTVPLTKVTEKSPYAYCIESQRRVAQDIGAAYPPVIADSLDTRRQILEALRANKLFGFTRILVKNQRMVPATKTQGDVKNWGPVECTPGGEYIESPDGGGGTFMAMGDKGFLILDMLPDGTIMETAVEDKSPLEWLDENYPGSEQPEAVDFIQTDMAVDADAFEGLTGTRAEEDADVAAMTYDYPLGISVTPKKDKQGKISGFAVGEMYKLGTVFSVVGAQHGEIVEYADRGAELQDRIMNTLYGATNEELDAELARLVAANNIDLAELNSQPDDQRENTLTGILGALQKGIDSFLEARQDRRPAGAPSLQGNVGAYSIKWGTFKNMVAGRVLKPHVQWAKKQKLADGTEVVCETSELYAPDVKPKKVFSVPKEDAIPAKDPAQFVACRNALAERHKTKLTTEFGVTQIGDGAVIEFSPLFRGTIDESLRIGKGAKLYLGGNGIGNGFNIRIGRNVEISDGATLIIAGNGPVIIEDGTRFEGGGTIVIKAKEDGLPITVSGNIVVIPGLTGIIKERGNIVIDHEKNGNLIQELRQRLGVSEAEARRIIEESVGAVRSTFIHVGKPLTMAPYADGLGGTYMGAAQIVTYLLRAAGRQLPPGQDYFLLPEQVEPFVQEAVGAHPYLAREEVSLDVDDGKGGSEKRRCTRYYNTLYRKVLVERSEEITDEEIDFMLQNLGENSVERYLIMYLKGVPVRAQADAERMKKKIAARPKDKRAAIWQENRAAAEREQRVFTEIWKRIEARAAALITSRAIVEGSGAFTTWMDVSTMPIDPTTGLPTGNPERKPFADDIDVEATHASVKRMFVEWMKIISTVSGIRGQYGDPFGDMPLPPALAMMGGVFDCGTQPIPSALVGAASQIEQVLQVIENRTKFLNQIPVEKMKGDTPAKKKNEWDKTLAKCNTLLEKTQKGKRPIDRAKGKPPKVVVFRETRSTGDALADVDIRAALAMGAEVEYAEVADVTAAANYVRENSDIHIGIYISASHNPEADNGLKILLGDGRVAPSDLAYPFIFVYHNLLCQEGHTADIIARINGVNPGRVGGVYARSRDVSRRVREMEEEYLLKMMTGQTDLAQARRVRDEMAKVVTDAGLAIVQERNGSSRNDEWLEDFGFAVITCNERYRYDMNRPLCPYPAAVAQAGPRVAAAIDVLEKHGFKVCISQHPDVDGDRSLFPVMAPDGKLFVRPDHVERTFITTCANLPLDEQYWDYSEHASIRDERHPENSRILAYSVNDPSSIGMEVAADVMGFIVLRRQVGEANVADGMEYLANLTWGETKRVASAREEWLYIPKKLLERFRDPKYDNVKLTCLGGGEASNGSFFDLKALVREPSKHSSSFMKLFHPVNGPKRMRELLHLFGKEDQFDPHWWDADQMRYLPYRLLQILPATRDACYFTPKSLAQIENPPIGLLGLVSENMDDILFDEGVMDKMCRGLEDIWAQKGVNGKVRPVALNIDDRSYTGRGNCQTDVPIGLQLRGGGYEIIFEIEINGVAYPFSWGWKRGSQTESRLTRVGPSAGFPVLAVMDGNIGSISAADENTQQALVDECFNYIRLHFTAALWKAMALATKEMLTCDPAAEAPKPQRLQRYIDAVNDGPGEFARKMHPELAAWVEDDVARLNREIPEAIQHNRLVDREVIEHARAAYFINRLPLDRYREFLMQQQQLAREARAAVLEIIDLYLGELSGLGQLISGADTMLLLTSI